MANTVKQRRSRVVERIWREAAVRAHESWFNGESFAVRTSNISAFVAGAEWANRCSASAVRASLEPAAPAKGARGKRRKA